jgi:redox-sensing transcriptional repressor
MATVRKSGIPVPSLKRLSVYYRLLTAALEQGGACISSEELGSGAGVSGAQVRKDLSYLPEYGRPGVGYDTRALAGYLEELLGLVNDKEAILVGAGNLGRALLSYPGFERYGLEIIAVFDRNQDKVGQVIAGREVLPVSKLPDLTKRLHVQIGIICVPTDQAQYVAELMVQGGVDVIWNFAPCHLSVPEHVLVKNEDLAAELATLSHHITQRKLAAQMNAEATAGRGVQVERTD